MGEAKRNGRNRVTMFHNEQRVAMRYPLRPSTILRLSPAGRQGKYPVRGVDLSVSGVLVESDLQVDTKEKVTLFLGNGETVAEESAV